jgi:hypothetical protein
MAGTDIAFWKADGANSEMIDMYAVDEITPIVDSQNNY